MIRAIFCPTHTHRISPTCDDPTLWRTVPGGVTCVCKEKKWTP